MPDAEGLARPEAPPEPFKDLSTSKDLVKHWSERVRAAEAARRRDKLPETWKRWQEKASGKWQRRSVRKDEVFVNKPYAVIRSILGQVYSRNPEYKVTSREGDLEAQENADNLSSLLNATVEKIGLKREAKLAEKQALAIGGSWLKCFWKSKKRTIQLGSEPQLGLPSPNGNDGLAGNPPPVESMEGPLAAMTPAQPASPAQPISYEIEIGEPRVRWARAEEVYPDPEATRIEDCRWIAHRVVRATDSVKSEPGYINTEDLKATHKSSSIDYSMDTKTPAEKPHDSDRTIIWEIEDFEHGMLFAFAEGHDLPLRAEADPYAYLYEELGLVGGMWTRIEADEDTESINGIGVMAIIEAICDELNVLRTRALNHTKRALGKVEVQKGALDQAQLDGLTSGDDMAVVEVNQTGAIKPLEFPNLPLDNKTAEAAINSDIAQTAGSSELQRGVSPQGSQTATEITVIGQNERIAVGARVDIIEDTMRSVGKKVLAMLRRHMETEQSVRIMGKEGQTSWRRFVPSEVPGEFDLSVEYGSTVQRDKIEQRQVAMNLYNLLKDEPVIGQRRVEIVKDILRAFDRKNVEAYIDPQWLQILLAGGGKAIAPGPATPIPGVASARPLDIGQRLAAGVPQGGESPLGPVPSLGQIISAAQTGRTL